MTVENHPGAGSTAAPALVAKSSADGYTLLVNTSAQAYTAVLVKNPPYDPLKDFTAVAPLTGQPYVLVSGTSTGITTGRELIAAAKAKPGGLKFGSTGIGTLVRTWGLRSSICRPVLRVWYMRPRDRATRSLT